MAAQTLKNELPTHLKPSDHLDEAEFKRHHGKTRSHMVSFRQFQQPLFRHRFPFPGCLAKASFPVPNAGFCPMGKDDGCGVCQAFGSAQAGMAEVTG